MAKEVTDALYRKLVEIVKKNPDQSETFYAEKSGIPKGQLLTHLVKAEVEADPSLKIKGTGAAIVNAREKEGLRWPRIAARTGKTVSEVQAMFEEHSGKPANTSYSGRGRNFADGGGGGRKSSGGGRKKSGTARGTSGRRAAAKKTAAAPAGRGRGRKTAAAAGKTAGRGRGRNKTRADRAAASGDPS